MPRSAHGRTRSRLNGSPPSATTLSDGSGGGDDDDEECDADDDAEPAIATASTADANATSEARRAPTRIDQVLQRDYWRQWRAHGVGLGVVELEHQLSLGGTSADGDGSAAVL